MVLHNYLEVFLYRLRSDLAQHHRKPEVNRRLKNMRKEGPEPTAPRKVIPIDFSHKENILLRTVNTASYSLHLIK